MVVLYPRWRSDRCSPLPGLTAEETREFQHLDSMSPADKTGWPLIGWEARENEFPPSQQRWLELYRKYRAACVAHRHTNDSARLEE
jgi:hypothetical protein